MEMRTCRICNEEKKLIEFEIDSRRDGYYTNRCKSCKTKSTDKANQAFYKLCLRAEAAGNKVEVTLDEVKLLFAAFDGMCVYCGAQEDPEGHSFHLEHVIPRSQGGVDHISNLVVSCKTCNSKKGTKPVVSYFYDEESFKDDNFGVLMQYLALSSGQPKDVLLESMVNDHVLAELRKKRLEMERRHG